MIAINAKFSPFRMILARRGPVELKVDLANKDKANAILTLEIKLGSRLSLDRVGYKTSDIKRIESLKAGETKTLYFDIWPKNAASSTEEPVRLILTEHEGSFNEVKDQTTENMSLRID
ncbi:MAG: hypothetical protein PHD95_05580 [Candidatus ainarchaeum sp.]|nr:hypothetical protein [Candidatus ainarchaeum sp.]